MIYDYISLDRLSKQPLYVQLYSTIKSNIENGNIQKNIKLPSIRKLSEDLKISKTTVENAYSQLCAEGYIINKPQSGYYTAQLLINSNNKTHISDISDKNRIESNFKYDFTGKSVDIGDISLKLWKKYIRYIINCEYLITSYGHPQGERSLREALSKYSYSVRGVVANSDDIIIGAGTQPLLYLLCGLLRKSYGNTIAIEKYGFTYAEKVFEDCNINIDKIDCDEDGIIIDSLEKSQARILLINPSGNLQTGNALKVDRRTAVLNWAERNNCIIIEDDYNGELKYSTNPVPAMQGYNKNRVVYLGSFSKLLLPSVRISYMVLPGDLLEIYNNSQHMYNQTASKMEQLALGKYIADGQLERSLRRLRKIYRDKSEYMIKVLYDVFGDDIKVSLKETSLCVNVVFLKGTSVLYLKQILAEKGVKIISSLYNESAMDLSFSGIEKDKILQGVEIIKNAVITYKE